ncbi:hypothetical protein HRI97_09295 [Treponema socranskii subsp. buccale]|jgi:hypothetical protein|uniref:hypothetical protein n=1 Tax=Treponema socranskii TaxID=53419 RepID=UPI0020A31E5B|nr:hypothetical protein [Treponema socranskii]UTD03239.1 hypothetical protein HRI97_09295 [Treponema socranskii subsp. buccale]
MGKVYHKNEARLIGYGSMLKIESEKVDIWEDSCYIKIERDGYVTIHVYMKD